MTKKEEKNRFKTQNRQQVIKDFYNQALAQVGGEEIVDKLFEQLEAHTGQKSTSAQKELMYNYLRRTTMKWSEVYADVKAATEDEDVKQKLAKEAKKTSKG